MQNEKPNLSWPKGSDPHTHAIALLDRIFGRTGHAPSTIYIVENYLREKFIEVETDEVQRSKASEF